MTTTLNGGSAQNNKGPAAWERHRAVTTGRMVPMVEDEVRAAKLTEWAVQERVALFADFGSAANRAIRAPDPHDPERWSIEMHNLAERIREVDALLGDVADWRNVGWSVWPYFEYIARSPLPAEAWEWLHQYQERNTMGHGLDSIRWVLQYRPVAPTT